jgi:D-amino-acid dehydrogenase
VDRDPEGDKASYGNAGGIAVTEVVPAATPRVLSRVPGWLLDPLGPLAIRPAHAISLIPWLLRFGRASERGEFERISRALGTLNASIYDDLIPMLRVTGLLSDLHQKGALSVYETEGGYLRDSQEWQCKRSMGVVVEEMTGNEARLLEPSLGPLVQRAVLTPQWSHVSDPKTIVQGIFRWLVSHGVTIRAGSVSDIVSSSAGAPCIQLDGGEMLVADKAVNAAGAWSGILARRIGDRVLLESERGYNATLPTPGVEIERQLIFAERKFVATPLSCGLRIGGAAEFGGLEAAPNFKRSQALVALAQRYLPKLDTRGATNWAGHRPTTPDGLPVIGYSTAQPNVIHAFGHGHLGLTQAATTGRLVAELAFQQPATIDLTPFAISRFG